MFVIHTFASSGAAGLRAFTDEADGRSLPAAHGPWKHIGIVRPGRDLPHRADRSTVEKAIVAHGFQMWRLRKPAA